MNRSNNNNRLPRGTPTGAQGYSNLAFVPKYVTDWTEPSYSNNKSGDNIYGLKRVCSRACLICPMLQVDSFVIQSTANNRKYPMLTNQDVT